MSGKFAVMFVHGVETADPHFADRATTLLKRAFSTRAEMDAEDALVIRSAYWAPVSQPYEDRLLNRLGGTGGKPFFDWLNRAGAKIDAGSVLALGYLALSGLLRVVPGVGGLHYPTLRWLAINYVGDAIAYQISPSDRALYDAVHAVLAATMHELATHAGSDAPLCVIAHSLGTVVASNYLYDLEVDGGVFGNAAASHVTEIVQPAIGDTPLERAETLASFYTLGSPLALWTLRYEKLDRPLIVPHPRLAEHRRGVGGRWVNVYDPDDVVASPLATLSDDYASALVDECRNVGPRLLGATPLAHPWYWNDPGVMTGIGEALAEAWLAQG